MTHHTIWHLAQERVYSKDEHVNVERISFHKKTLLIVHMPNFKTLATRVIVCSYLLVLSPPINLLEIQLFDTIEGDRVMLQNNYIIKL